MSYKIEIFNPHEINRDLATILGNAARTDWQIKADDIQTWLSIQKKMFPSWEDLFVKINSFQKTVDIYQSVFGEDPIILSTLILMP